MLQYFSKNIPIPILNWVFYLKIDVKAFHIFFQEIQGEHSEGQINPPFLKLVY